jgi:hypothetical protein
MGKLKRAWAKIKEKAKSVYQRVKPHVSSVYNEAKGATMDTLRRIGNEHGPRLRKEFRAAGRDVLKAVRQGAREVVHSYFPLPERRNYKPAVMPVQRAPPLVRAPWPSTPLLGGSTDGKFFGRLIRGGLKYIQPGVNAGIASRIGGKRSGRLLVRIAPRKKRRSKRAKK